MNAKIFSSLVLAVMLSVVFSVSQVGAQMPEVKVVLQSEEKPIRLVSLEAKVRIYGYLAETTMTMKFLNPNRRTLEGELYFPLPEGAMVSGYGLDVDGDMVDGVAVEKQKAREVFETEVRRGVDPGLVEKVKGNNFKTRIYPLIPGKTRTVKIVFTDDLRENDAAAVYRLPLQLSRQIEQFFLRVEVFGAEKQPEISVSGLKTDGFKAGSAGWFAEFSGSGSDLKSELVVQVPQKESEQIFVEEASDGRFYFCIQGSRRNPAPSSDAKAASSLTILYDVSDSGKKRDRELEKKVLQKILGARILQKDAAIFLVPFRNQIGKVQKFDSDSAGVEKLFSAIDNLYFDGATSFSGLENLDELKSGIAVLFSDGINTFGKNQMPVFAIPVYTFASGAGADFDFLHAIARKSGGRMFNLKEMSGAEAVKAMQQPFYGITRKLFGKGIADAAPSGVQEVDGRFSFSGVLETAGSEVELSFGDGQKIIDGKAYKISKNDAIKGDFIRKVWAGARISDLMLAKDNNRREIIALSSRHGIVTEFTSMIVLERIEQYIEHRIVPPASKPEWRNEYFRVLEANELAENQERSKNIENILSMWNARLEWWKKDFSGVDTSKAVLSKGKMALDRSVRSEANSMIEGEVDRAMPQSIPAPSGAVDSFSDDSLSASEEIMSKSEDFSDNREMKKEAAPSKPRPVNPGVAIKAWKPDAEYARKIAKADDKLNEYLQQKVEFGDAPSFYLDCSDVFAENDQKDLAIQVLSNLAELELENPALLRILAHRLAQLGQLEAASLLFAEVLEMRKEEPQSYRDLALVLGRMERYEEAVKLLYEVVQKTWDGRFPEIEVIALEEMNNLIVKAKRTGIDKFSVDERLIAPIDVDLRIVMTWDADMTDMDLWVIEPTGEKAFYSNPRSMIGGLVSRDFTRGYGPEEYMIKKARTGSYEIQTNFYGSTSQKIAGAVTLQVDIFTNYGREDEKCRSVTLRLKENKETFTVAEIEF